MDLVLSVLLYLFAFGFTLLLFFQVERNIRLRDGKVDFTTKLLAFSAIVPVCVLAGLRSDSVGVDTKNVVDSFLRTVKMSSFNQVSIGNEFEKKEFLYGLLIFGISRITDQPAAFLFLLQLLSIGPVAYLALKMRKQMPVSLVMAVYLFCFYNNSLNLMRQSIACSFILLGTFYLFSKNKMDSKKAMIGSLTKCLMCYVFSILIHKAAIIGVVIVILLFLLTKNKLVRVIRCFLYALIICLPIFIPLLFQFFTSLGIMNQSFNYYYDIFVDKSIKVNYFANPYSLYCIVDMVMRIVLVSVPTLMVSRIKNMHSVDFLKTISFCGFLMFVVILFSFRTSYGQRMAMFLDYFLICYMPIAAIVPNRRFKKQIISVTLVFYWFVWIIVFGWSGSQIYALR